MSEKAIDTVEKAETQPGASEPVEVENAVNAEDQQGTYSQYLRRTTGNYIYCIYKHYFRSGSRGNLPIDCSSSSGVWSNPGFGKQLH
jgi:hypothetical protein